MKDKDVDKDILLKWLKLNGSIQFNYDSIQFNNIEVFNSYLDPSLYIEALAVKLNNILINITKSDFIPTILFSVVVTVNTVNKVYHSRLPVIEYKRLISEEKIIRIFNLE